MLRTSPPEDQALNMPGVTPRLDQYTIESLFRGFRDLMLGKPALESPTLFEAIMNMSHAMMMQNVAMLQEIQLLKAILIQWRNEVKHSIDNTAN